MRDRWSSRTIFLFAAIGSAVGLGNVWRFPYLTYKFGGGAFLIPYLIALFLIGIPMLILEFALGQKIQRGAVESFKKINRKLKGIGTAAIITGFIVVIYYAVVMAWSLVFFVNSFNLKLPWADDSKSYFYNNVLGVTSSVSEIGGINWTILIALFFVWLGIYFSVRKGVKSVGKVVAITMPLPIILLIILFIRGITLPGSWSGVLYYLKPDFSTLLSSDIWIAAISQIFFTLSLAFGIMIAYASFNKKDQDVVSDSYITAITNSAISLFAGFVVFSVVGYMAFSTGSSIDKVVAAGPGLAFVVFPKALSMMPLSWFFSILFFLTLLSLGIDSAFSLVEAVNTSITDVRNKRREEVAFWVCLIAFVFGIIFTTGAGIYFLDIVDHFATNYGLVLVGIFEAVAVGWIYGASNLRSFINSTRKTKLGSWWDISVKFIIPLALIFLIAAQFVLDIKNPYGKYPGWALGIGWVVALVPLLIVLNGLFNRS